VEVRRRTRPMVCFVNVESVDRIIYSIFQRFNLEWKTRTLSVFTQGLDVTRPRSGSLVFTPHSSSSLLFRSKSDYSGEPELIRRPHGAPEHVETLPTDARGLSLKTHN